MKHSTLALAMLGTIFTVGCGSGKSEQLSAKAPRGYPKGTQPVAVQPEIAITKLETSEDRAEYLGELAKDSAFEPQKHAEMLKKYSNDPNPEVAGKAKELLARGN